MTKDRINVLLTGATGFLGGYVLRELITHNCLVTATYRGEKPKSIVSQDIQWVQSDMESGFPEQEIFEVPDLLVHLAWGGLPNYYSNFHVNEELPRQQLFLQQAVQFGIKNMFVVGTCFEYGKINGILKEDFATYPHTQYGVAKDQLRQFLQGRQKETRFNLTWGRLFYLYGEGQGERSLYTLLQNAITANDKNFDMSLGEQERDFLPIQLAAKYIVDLALLRRDLGLINICSGEPKTVKSLVQGWLDDANIQMKLNLGAYPYPEYEAMRFWGDNTKLSSALSES